MPTFGIFSLAYTTATTYKTLGLITPITAVPVELIYIAFEGSGSVAPSATDIQHEGNVTRLTSSTAGALSAQTPALMEESAAARATYAINTGTQTEPATYGTVIPLVMSFNQRNAFVWGKPIGQGIKTNASMTEFRLGARIRSSSAGPVDFNAHVWEP